MHHITNDFKGIMLRRRNQPERRIGHNIEDSIIMLYQLTCRQHTADLFISECATQFQNTMMNASIICIFEFRNQIWVLEPIRCLNDNLWKVEQHVRFRTVSTTEWHLMESDQLTMQRRIHTLESNIYATSQITQY